MAKFIQSLNFSKRTILALILATAIAFNLFFTYLVISINKDQFLGKSILSQTEMALSLLSRDINNGNYRKVMEKISTQQWPNESSTDEILLYDMESREIITANSNTPILVCPEDATLPQYIKKMGYTACIPFNSTLLIQVSFSVNPLAPLGTPQFILILVCNFIFAIILTVVALSGMNLYLSRFLNLLSKVIGKKHLDKSIPHEFKASFKHIAKLSQNIDQLKRSLQNQAKQATANEVYQKIIHNMRNPLSNINGVLSEIKLSGYNEEKSEMIREGIKEIEISVSKALEDYRSSKKESPYQIIDLVRVEVTKNLGDHINIPPIDASPEAQDCLKEIEAHDFKSAITNILNNAVEAMPNGGSVSISMTLKDTLQISIADEGTGIDPEVLPKVGSKGFSYKKKTGQWPWSLQCDKRY